MRVEEAIRNRRSIRRFRQDPVPVELLHRLSDLARLYPSAGNQQPIRTAIVTKAPHLQEVFKTLRWAMYLPDYAPAENERPTAYLILLSEHMKLILAHLGSEEHIEAIRKARYQNIYTDTSGQASVTNNLLEYTVEQVGADKIFFGTDTYSSAFQRGRIELARICAQDKRKILRDNALLHFPKINAYFKDYKKEGIG